MIYSRRQALKLFAGSGAALSLAPQVFGSPNQLTFRAGKPLLQLNFNENSVGMSPLAREAARKAMRDAHNRYPDPQMEALKEALAEKHDVDPSQIILGNGSTEILQLTMSYAAQKNAQLVDAETSYGQVRTDAVRWGVRRNFVPNLPNFSSDLEGMKAAANQITGTVLINICNPNNPTGTILPAAELKDWISNAPRHHIFLMDEAYYDYAIRETDGYDSMLPLIKAGRENLIIARTFSKVHGMAGLRVGYGIAASHTAREIRGYSSGINLNVVGAAAALASLSDKEFYEKSLAMNVKAKSALLKTLKELELDHVPSSTNFVLHRINDSSRTYQRNMHDNNILVGRPMTREDGWNRLSLGTPEQMVEFSRTLKAFRERGWA